MELLAILSMMAVGLALLAMYVHGTEQRPKRNRRTGEPRLPKMWWRRVMEFNA